ncbi:MAG: acetylornithine deacetylase, partial [Candidatus Entotheonellia bacterium]
MPTITDAPVDVPVKRVPLSAEQRHWLEQAISHVDEARMRALNRTLTDIHSPTGEEREISEWMARHMQEIGLHAFYQPLDERSGNAIGQLKG